LSDWHPILSAGSETAERAWDSVEAITADLLDQNPAAPAVQQCRPADIALLSTYLALNGRVEAETAVNHLNRALDDAGRTNGFLGLYGGLSGVAWAVEHCCRTLAEGVPDGGAAGTEADDANADIDAWILRCLRRPDWSGPFDLIRGLVGVGTYFLDRLPHPSAVEAIQHILGHLERSAERDGGGVTWHSAPSQLAEWQRERSPHGYYDLGVAHGVPGVIHFLGEALATDLESDRVRPLLEGAMAWLVSQQRPPESLSRFSSWVAPGAVSSDSRLGWCYGDLGVAAVALQVARRAGREDWRAFGLDLVDHCLSWPAESSGVRDAGLCHGAAGVAHVFNRIYQSEGHAGCLEAACEWIGRAVEMRRPGGSTGGYYAHRRPHPAGPPVWDESAAFLDGAAGIALALVAALTSVAPGWDRLLMLSGVEARMPQ